MNYASILCLTLRTPWLIWCDKNILFSKKELLPLLILFMNKYLAGLEPTKTDTRPNTGRNVHFSEAGTNSTTLVFDTTIDLSFSDLFIGTDATSICIII
jgi:hypothetical protein